MKTKKLILFIVLFFVGGVFASSTDPLTVTKIDERSEYSRSLNATAMVMMNWYGSLITDTSSEASKIEPHFDTRNIGDQWVEYRSQYPKNISQILIIKTKLLKSGEDYQFQVMSKISYKNNNKLQTNTLSETFIINHELLDKPLSFVSPIKSVKLNSNTKISTLDTTQYNREHYKIREFLYAWLSYLDGVSTLNSVMNADSWLNKATYSLVMGADRLEGSISTVLTRRNKTLANGGHLLRSLEKKKSEGDSNTFVLDIILEWKGLNAEGKSVIAKIHQKLKIHIKKDNSWELISIKEKHLLPIIAPWMGMLC